VGVTALYHQGPALAYRAVGSWLPGWLSSPARFLRKFMHSVKGDDNWVTVSERLLEAAQQEAPGYIINATIDDPVAVQTLLATLQT